MQPTQKDKAQELLDNLRSRPNSDVPEFVQYLKLLYEDAKDRLVSCTDGDIPRVRGEAATYKKLIDALVRPSLKTKQ